VFNAMLISNKDIANAQPPLLMKFADGNWKLVINIIIASSFEFEILEKDNTSFTKRVISQVEPPFYVGEDVWELNYGATIMTLGHESLAGHPANQFWEDWKSSC